jgi:hypothetical protein
MKQWLWIILLLPVSPLVAKDKKLGGYVLDAAAFRKIQTYCVDTHNLPPREVAVISEFLARESKPTGLLAELPWHLLATCGEGDPDAIVRAEFPPGHFQNYLRPPQIRAVLLVFRAGSPTPIYETRALWITDGFEGHSEIFAAGVMEHTALYCIVSTLIHDWRQLSGTLHAAAS